MNYRAVFRYIGYILMIEGGFMLPALIISFVLGEKGAALSFVASAFATCLVGFLFTRLRSDGSILAREGFVTVALGWVFMSLFGALPFWISREIPRYIDALFETVSGFTTTGSSILTNVEALSTGLLYWRSFIIWLGGMGVLVFVLAIIPIARGNGSSLHLMRAESPGPSVGKLAPTMRHTSRVLYSIYIGMTIVQIIMLLCGGMPVFDAVTTAFSTAGTGGFSIKNASIGAYDSVYIQSVIAVFMALFGINFNVYYFILLRQFRAAFKNEELKAYILIMLGATAVIATNIVHMYENVGKAILDSFFQVSSVMTTTGFSTTDFNLWPQLSRYLLVALMFFGACAGSTGGGMKISRLIILAKHMKNELKCMINPRTVRTVLMDGKTVDSAVLRGTTSYLVAYFLICLISMGIISLDNFSLETTVTSVIACFNNIGPGLDVVGPVGNFASFSWLSKVVLSLDMLFGRLEIFPMLMLFSPAVWKRKV